MTKISEIAAAIERRAPLTLAAEWDNSGLTLGDPDRDVTGALVCEDVTPAIVDEAIACGCDLIVSHHPVLFRGVNKIEDGEYVSEILIRAIRGGVALYCAHTNLDACAGGLNDALCRALGYLPDAGDDGFYRVGRTQGGKIGTVGETIARLADLTGRAGLRLVGDLDAPCRTICVSTGSGGRDETLIATLRARRVDLLITAEVKHSIARQLDYYGIALAECTHYASENICKQILSEWLADAGVKIVASQIERSPYL